MEWLVKDVELSQYEKNFKEHHIDGMALSKLVN